MRTKFHPSGFRNGSVHDENKNFSSGISFSRKKIFLLTQVLFSLAFTILFAQNASHSSNGMFGELRGQITEATTGEGIIAPTIKVYENSVLITGTIGDFDGNYIIKPIAPGSYDLMVTSLGFDTVWIKELKIGIDSITLKNISMTQSSKVLKEVMIVTEPILNPGNVSSCTTISKEKITQYAINRSNINNISAKTAGVFQTDNNAPYLNGGRIYSQQYYVDGVPMRGSISLPSSSIEQITVITGGLPAKYGDASGNIVSDPLKLFGSKKQIPLQAPPVDDGIVSIPAPVAVYNPPPVIYSNEEYAPLIENEYLNVSDEPLSTFSIDADDASYCNFRRFVQSGSLPPKDAIRIEEFINNFSYHYPQPTDGHPFSINMEQSVCPWNTAHQLVRIGIKGREMNLDTLPPSNLVFLIDVSGSMESEDKLELVKKCFYLLVKELRPIDKVAIVVYAGNSGVVLPSTPGDKQDKIIHAIENLQAGGSTAGGAGIELAYKIAKENFITHGNNRVILATDGDFNVGVSSEADLLTLIESKRDDGIFLTTLGFGTGNYKDAKMELLADKGNGNYSYVDSYQQGMKIFVEQLTSTLYTIAKDVKFQIEFNPKYVQSYRLIGYENRLMPNPDFNNDLKDAGEIGAGTAATALYELIPAGSGELISSVDTLKYQYVSLRPNSNSEDEILNLKMRYKLPNEDQSQLIVVPLKYSSNSFENCSSEFQFAAAVAEFAMLIRESKFISASSFQQSIDIAALNKGTDADGARSEFIELAKSAAKIYEQLHPVTAEKK